ncbi:hypothetical protein DIPPA_26531 [Diplonema papillatum]|nr:hypothetical protein DIPPA_26531 [Diplonema papillatum]
MSKRPREEDDGSNSRKQARAAELPVTPKGGGRLASLTGTPGTKSKMDMPIPATPISPTAKTAPADFASITLELPSTPLPPALKPRRSSVERANTTPGSGQRGVKADPSYVHYSANSITPSPLKSEGPPKIAVKRQHQPAPMINLNKIIHRDFRKASLHDIIYGPPSVLRGLSGSERTLAAYGINSVQDLANWQPYRVAKALKVAADDGEELNGRAPGCHMNIQRALDSRQASASFGSMLELPLSALVALGTRADEDFQQFGLTRIVDLAMWYPALTAPSALRTDAGGILGSTRRNDLANWQPYRVAKVLKVAADDGEEPNGRAPGCHMNIQRALDSRQASASFGSMLELPLSALVALGTRADEDFQQFGLTRIVDLAMWYPASLHSTYELETCAAAKITAPSALRTDAGGVLGSTRCNDLANWQPYRVAKVLNVAADDGEEPNGRAPGCHMNIQRALDSRQASASFGSMLELPLSALVALGTRADEDFQQFGLTRIVDLAMWYPASLHSTYELENLRSGKK